MKASAATGIGSIRRSRNVLQKYFRRRPQRALRVSDVANACAFFVRRKQSCRFPFSARPLMAAWNGLFLGRNTFTASATQSAQWNRGAYLVNGLGHCSACHTPRNAFGAEKSGAAFIGGGSAEGWEAPALSSLSNAPVPWTEDELFRCKHFGHAPLHGIAAYSMAPVVADLAALPDSDIRAMATYLASLAPVEPNVDVAAMARQYEAAEHDQRRAVQRRCAAVQCACASISSSHAAAGRNCWARIRRLRSTRTCMARRPIT